MSNLKKEFTYDVALIRLMYAALAGFVVVLFYALRAEPPGVRVYFGVVTVGLMSGLAAFVSGGLLGFLFGVPHSRGTEDRPTPNTESKGDIDAKNSAQEARRSYTPNTSLEQISDWLTKMLVGVGLIEIKVLPGKLQAISAYLSKGLPEAAESFVSVVLIYFSVCGFVFGFLWARIYLARWFREADEVKNLAQKVSQLEEKQHADALALVRVTQSLNPAPDETPPDSKELAHLIKTASAPVKAQIFAQAKAASEDYNAKDHQAKLEAVIPIFSALIESDTKGIFHRNHGELSYALRRRKPPNLLESEKEASLAIQIRDQIGVSGWKYYEFHRARLRIRMDPKFKDKQVSEPALREQIISDLKPAYAQPDRWKEWFAGEEVVREWMRLNDVKESDLT